MCLFAMVACTETPAPPGDRSEPATSTEISALGNACTIQCRNANIQCNSVCLRNPRPNCEENCDTRFLNCMRSCGCPFSEEFDVTSFDHSTPTNTFVCVGPPNRNGFTYQRYDWFGRTDHKRRTLECDGTTTETTLSSTVFFDGPCYRKLFPDQGCTLTQVSVEQICTF